MKILSLLLTIPMLTNVSIAEEKITIEKLDKDFYNKHIRYSEYGDRVKYKLNSDSVQSFEPKALAVLKENKQLIYETAKKFPDVHPETIAACILAENTMNVGVSDQAQMWLANNSKMAFSIASKVFGKSSTTVSLGLGQINVEAARAAEPYIQKLENRKKPRTDDELLEQIKTAEGSLLYAGGILQDAIDKYKEAGFDITQRPDVQCTLYNIGKAERRAKRSKRNKRAPRVNYFGFYVNKSYHKVADEFKFDTLDETPKTNNPQAKVTARIATINMPIYSTPGTCKDGNVSKKHTKMAQMTSSKGKTVEEIGHSIDCELNAWTQVQTDGKIGWVPSEFLQKAIRFGQIEANKNNEVCDQEVVKACKEKIRDLRISIDPNNHRNVIKFNNAPIFSRKKNDDERYFDDTRSRASFVKDQILDELKRNHGVIDWDDPKNPYKNAFKWVKEYQDCNSSCYIDTGSNSEYDLYQALHRAGLKGARGASLLDKTNSNNKFLEYLKTIKVRKTRGKANARHRRFNHSREQRKDILSSVERKKNSIISWHNKNKRKKINKWDDAHNPYKDLFAWTDTYTQCDNCRIKIGTYLYGPYDLNRLVSRKGLLSSIGRQDNLRSIKVILNDNNSGNTNEKVFKKEFNKMADICTKADKKSIVSMIKSRYQNLNHQNLDEEDRKTFKRSLKEATKSCRTILICDNDPTTEDLTCNARAKDKNIDSACSYLNQVSHDLANYELQAMKCLLATDERCHVDVLRNKDKIQDIANLDCVDQVFLSDEDDVEELGLKMKDKPGLEKLMHSPFKPGKGMAISVKNACSVGKK